MISRQNKRIKLLEDRVEELTARQSFASTERQGAPSVPSLPPVPPMPFSQNRPASGGGLSQAVQTLALQGNKIMAIKQLRDETGLGLAEAKNAVEAFLEGR